MQKQKVKPSSVVCDKHSLTACRSASDPASLAAWLGSYTFGERAPETPWEYGITVFAIEERYYANISVDGGQTLRMMASVQGNAEEITLVFMNNIPGNRHNRFHEGDVLLTLRMARGALHTTWGALTPVLEENQAEGMHFVRQESEEPPTREPGFIFGN